MGFAKCHEDNIKLYEERMLYKEASMKYPCDIDTYVPKHVYKYRCPFCSSGFDNEGTIAKYIISNHGGRTTFVYLNRAIHIGPYCAVLDTKRNFVVAFRNLRYCMIILRFIYCPYQSRH
jgi:hypothetical protein